MSREPSIGRRISRTLARFLFVVLIGVGITLAWQSYREEAKEAVRIWVPSLGWVLPPTVKLAASADASRELGQQLKPIALDLALVRRSVEQLAGDLKQLAAKQEQMAQSLATLQAVESGPQTEHFISASICGSPDSEAQTHATPSAVAGDAVSRQGAERWRPGVRKRLPLAASISARLEVLIEGKIAVHLRRGRYGQNQQSNSLNRSSPRA